MPIGIDNPAEKTADKAANREALPEPLGGIGRPVEQAGGHTLLAIDLADDEPACKAVLAEGLPNRFDAVCGLPHVDKTILLVCMLLAADA